MDCSRFLLDGVLMVPPPSDCRTGKRMAWMAPGNPPPHLQPPPTSVGLGTLAHSDKSCSLTGAGSLTGGERPVMLDAG